MIKEIMLFVPAVSIISFFTALLLGSHYFLYFSLVNFFPIASDLQKNILIIFLIIFILSFYFSWFLSRRHENSLTRTYYLISSLWLGLLNNLILASFLVWIIILITWMADLYPNRAIIASFCFLSATGVTLHGIWNAFHPRLKNITVTIPHLPKHWKNKKIVQLSDVHLGQIYREKFLIDIIKKINSVKPEMVVITGDLFDGMDGDLSLITRPLGNIRSKQGSFFVTGNHETYLEMENIFSILKKYSIKILEDEVVDINGLKLIGIDYPRKGEKKDVIAVLNSLRDEYIGQPNILLYHTPERIREIKNTGINLELCGHTHTGQFFPFNLITKLIFHGFDYGLYPMGDYTLYATNGSGTWGPAVRIGNIPEIVVIKLK